MRGTAAFALVGLLAFVALGCSSTRLTSTWRDPALGPMQFRQVAGIALSSDSTVRRLAEDEFVRTVGPANGGIAGYALIPDEELRDRDQVRARLEGAGVDGAVVFRLVSVETQERWVPPTHYQGMWSYWGWAGPMVHDPGYLTTDQIIQVEFAAYTVRDARLVWAGRSQTFNPTSVERMIGEIVRLAVEELRREGLIAGL